MTTGNIPIADDVGYCTEEEWRAKYGISTDDESSAQFDIDLREAMFEVRRNCFYLVREKILYLESSKKSYFPYKWITDGDMDGTVTKSDFLVYQLASDGRSLEAVSEDDITSVDAFNNYVQFDSEFTATRQLFATFYICGKPLDEVTVDEIKRATMAQITILVINRIKNQNQLKGVNGWTAGGVTVNRDNTTYDSVLVTAEKDWTKYVAFLKPMVMRKIRTGRGAYGQYDPSVAYSSQVFARNARIGRGL